LTGKGCVFTYDAVGSYERTGYSAQGTGAALMMPVLDNQLKSPSPLLLPARVSSTSIFHTLNPLMGGGGGGFKNLKKVPKETNIKKI
jgi:hypothetical protein